MIRITFTEDDIEQLRKERFGHPHPRVQRKMEALLLKSEGLPHNQIIRIVGISENTLRQYLREYEEGGIERLKEVRFFRPHGELAEHRRSLETYFEDHPPATVTGTAIHGPGLWVAHSITCGTLTSLTPVRPRSVTMRISFHGPQLQGASALRQTR